MTKSVAPSVNPRYWSEHTSEKCREWLRTGDDTLFEDYVYTPLKCLCIHIYSTFPGLHRIYGLDEVINEAVIVLLEKKSDLLSDGNIYGYMFKTVRHNCISLLRRVTRYEPIQLDQSPDNIEDDGDFKMLDLFIVDNNTPADSLMQKEADETRSKQLQVLLKLCIKYGTKTWYTYKQGQSIVKRNGWRYVNNGEISHNQTVTIRKILLPILRDGRQIGAGTGQSRLFASHKQTRQLFQKLKTEILIHTNI